jgi:hypothetical protein
MNEDEYYDPSTGRIEKNSTPARPILWSIFLMIVLYAAFFYWLFHDGAPAEFPVRPHQRGMMIEHSTQS